MIHLQAIWKRGTAAVRALWQADRASQEELELAGVNDIKELHSSEIAFLICAEGNRLEPQALLLCESIRAFAGRYRNAPIIAVSPRPELALSCDAQHRIRRLGVDYQVLPLNRTGCSYGTINRILVGAWAERTLTCPYLVVLDTDTFFAGEPVFIRADAGVRPVDVKGAASSGPDDPLDAYWARICAFAGIELSRLPFLQTSVDRARVRASYNGGFTVIRRELGILQKTSDVFFASFAENVRPMGNRGLNVFASTGDVGLEASEWWGSSQAALSAAIWATTEDVHTYDASYNIPLHQLTTPGSSWPLPAGTDPVLIHYHYLAEPGFQGAFHESMNRLNCSDAVLAWIQEHLAYFSPAPLPQEKETKHPSISFCTMAIHAPYRRRARRLCQSLSHVPWLLLTDEPGDFEDLPVRTVSHVPTGPMAIDYQERLAPTGQHRGGAAYHDKRFALKHALDLYETAVFLDADSCFSSVPPLGPYPPGLCVLPVVEKTVAHHLESVGSWRLPAFEALAIHLTGGTDILHRARWCHESCLVLTKDGREGAFLDTWGRSAEFMQGLGVFSGEGGVIGIAAAMAGWTVDFEAALPIGSAVQHEGCGPKTI